MLDEHRIAELQERVAGEVLAPGDTDYDEVRRVWNGMIDRRPALIVRCRGRDDVVAALQLAEADGLAVSVRGGGHGVAGRAVADGGVMIDLSLMDGVEVDPEAKLARVQPGVRLGQLDAATQRHGLATTAGVDSRTGVAGLTLGGGIGFLARRYGLAIDNLVSAEVVTAAGRVVTASATENPDLYWGLRGAGAHFGVVTRFDFRLHPLGPEVMVAQVFLPREQAGDALRRYREFALAAPDELSCYAVFLAVPAAEPFPPARHGETALALVACHSGDPEAGRAALAPLADFGEPLLASIDPLPYVDLQQSFDAGAPDGERYYWKSHYVEVLSDAAIDALVSGLDPLPAPFTNVFLEPLGGAVARVPADATAFPHRSARWSLGIAAGWSDPADDDACIAWTRSLYETMAPYCTGGVYANYLDFDDDDKVAAAFGGNYRRLQDVKAQWDSDRRFGSIGGR